MDWQTIDSAPDFTDILVCVTYNVPSGDDDPRPFAGDGYVWETKQWVDSRSDKSRWFKFPRLIDVPFPPTHWMPLPASPSIGGSNAK